MGNDYLTILAGNPRGGENLAVFKKHVLTPLNSDLAICTGTKWIKNQSFLEYTKYKWVFEEPSEWFEYYKKIFLEHGNSILIQEKKQDYLTPDLSILP